MNIAARVTSKGQVTVPKAVREALGVSEGDAIIFRIEGNRAIVARTPDFIELAGTLRIPTSKKNAAWDHVIKSAHASRATRNS
ncbi:MAG: AbrB/MazE/SpoVT family DNA-binding domain-containing protein [Actinomycetales bacterium]|nr:AbrB/MazE/SpoVT family DNA-binding domain-containing protein [Actinomycetales bacterium]